MSKIAETLKHRIFQNHKNMAKCRYRKSTGQKKIRTFHIHSTRSGHEMPIIAENWKCRILKKCKDLGKCRYRKLMDQKKN